MNKLKFSFMRLPDADFGTKAESIVSDVASNTAYFPTPVPALSVITDVTGSYNDALVAAKSLGKTAVALKNMYRAEASSLLSQLGNYVMLTAAGDITMLIASGFDLAKTKEPSPPLVKPENFQVLEGINAGELLMKVKRQKS